jgi:YjbE family integral membrane protein
MPHFLPELLALLQILFIDLSMAGDNALVVGMAAAGLEAGKRHRAVILGIAGATILRILFAIFAVQILHITGLLVAGGLLLLWVAWKMYRELRHVRAYSDTESRHSRESGNPSASDSERMSLVPRRRAAMDSRFRGNDVESRSVKKLSTAVWQIIVADISMSLDNVLGVAGVARDHMWILAAGLALSVLLMGAASAFVARLVARHYWIGYLGLAVVLYTAVRMVVDGAKAFF